jgi:putative endonuclease
LARFDTIAVYLMTDRRFGVLYLGVTSDLIHRVSQHRAGEACAFTQKYKCTRLVWYEVHADADMRVAIQRETSLKRYRRAWKEKLIAESNPDWLDLWSDIRPGPFPGQWLSVEEVRRGVRLDPDE